MVAIQNLTVESMLGAPRRGPATPNPSGTLAMYTVATHSFEEGKTVQEIRILDLSVTYGPSELLWQTADGEEHKAITDAVWIPGADSQILYLRPGDKGTTQVMVADGADVKKDHYLVGEIGGPVSALKLKALDDGSIVFTVVGQVADDGSLYNSQTAEQKRSTGRVFDSNEIRVWNTLHSEQRQSIWYTKLVRKDSEDQWQLAGALNNLVTSPRLDAPVGLFKVLDPLQNFDIASHGVAFSARNLRKGSRVFIETSAWYVSVDDFTNPPSAEPREIKIRNRTGTSENVRFSPEGDKIALLFHDNSDWYNPRLLMCTPDDLETFDVFSLVLGAADDDDSDPLASFDFTGSADEIIMQSERNGRNLLFFLKLEDGATPQAITKKGSVAAAYPLIEGQWDKFLITSTSFVDSSLVQIADRSNAASRGCDVASLTTFSSASKHGTRFNLDWDEMVEEFWYEGADGKFVQCWMIKPMGFDENKKYPWILHPHGGPVAASMDAWTTLFNPALFAQQGYIVLLPNITGSTGFGKDFIRRVDGEWAGRPFTDILHLLDQLDNRPYLDQDKAVIAGGSYSAYLLSWMFGHKITKKFCCAIWHAGIFNIPLFELQTDLLDPEPPFDGPPFLWLNHANLKKFDPATPERLAKWKNAPPTLVSHNDKDYRCPITEGLAAMNTLLAQGVPCRFLTFPDECHFVMKPENSRMWHEVLLDWMGRCVNGELKRGDTDW